MADEPICKNEYCLPELPNLQSYANSNIFNLNTTPNNDNNNRYELKINKHFMNNQMRKRMVYYSQFLIIFFLLVILGLLIFMAVNKDNEKGIQLTFFYLI